MLLYVHRNHRHREFSGRGHRAFKKGTWDLSSPALGCGANLLKAAQNGFHGRSPPERPIPSRPAARGFCGRPGTRRGGTRGLPPVKQMAGALLCTQGKRPGVKWETFTYTGFACAPRLHTCAGHLPVWTLEGLALGGAGHFSGLAPRALVEEGVEVVGGGGCDLFVPLLPGVQRSAGHPGIALERGWEGKLHQQVSNPCCMCDAVLDWGGGGGRVTILIYVIN